MVRTEPILTPQLRVSTIAASPCRLKLSVGVAFMIAFTKAFIAQKSSVDRHTVEAAKCFSVRGIRDTSRANRTDCWLINVVLPFAETVKHIIWWLIFQVLHIVFDHRSDILPIFLNLLSGKEGKFSHGIDYLQEFLLEKGIELIFIFNLYYLIVLSLFHL